MSYKPYNPYSEIKNSGQVQEHIALISRPLYSSA